jgi:phosphoribosylpyrophosphate synthetase
MNDDFMELFLLINAVKNSFAKSVHLIIPYISYSRQDKIHDPRE